MPNERRQEPSPGRSALDEGCRRPGGGELPAGQFGKEPPSKPVIDHQVQANFPFGGRWITMIPLPTGGVQRERGGSGPYGQPPAGDDVHQERGEGLNSGGGESRKTEPFR